MIQFMRGTSTLVTSQNPTLQAGQPFYETDTHKLKIGDGSTAWSSLPYIGEGGSSSGASSKKYATVVIGHQDSGLTESDVDYLMSGTSADNEKWRKATGWYDISGYKYVLILPGTYDVSNLGTFYCGNSVIQGCRGTILTCSDIATGGDNQIYSNLEFNMASSGASNGFNVYNTDITISNCKITAAGRGIYASNANNLTVYNCNISGTFISAIRFNTASNFHIYHNTMSTTSNASPSVIYFQGNVENGIIEGNYIYSEAGNGFRSESTSTVLDNVSISNNSIMAWSGNVFNGSWTNVRINNNTLQCDGGYAVQFPTSTRCSVQGNTIPGSSGLGVNTTGSGLTECMISNNYFRNANVTLGTCTNCYVVNNYCRAVSLSGSGNVNRDNGTA